MALALGKLGIHIGSPPVRMLEQWLAHLSAKTFEGKLCSPTKLAAELLGLARAEAAAHDCAVNACLHVWHASAKENNKGVAHAIHLLTLSQAGQKVMPCMSRSTSTPSTSSGFPCSSLRSAMEDSPMRALMSLQAKGVGTAALHGNGMNTCLARADMPDSLQPSYSGP